MIYKAPERVNLDSDKPTIFLGGTIDMGNSIDWQSVFSRALELGFGDDIDIYNPRRDSWDSSWEQSINNPQFEEQVTWELDMLDRSDIVIINLKAGSKSPISLLELGLCIKNVVVCCPEGFYRKGNVDIVCKRHGIPVYTNEIDLLDKVFKMIRTYEKSI